MESRAAHDGGGRRQGRKKRRKKKKRCGGEQVKKGVGACIFTLGIPMAIAGIILTVVSSNNVVSEYPPFFKVLGPVLLSLSPFFFLVGSVLAEIIDLSPLLKCLMPEDVNNHCWQKCPGLCALLHPNHVRNIDKSGALYALQTEPSKSALKKPQEPEAKDLPERRTKGVRFSDGGDDVPLHHSSSTDQSEAGADPNAERVSTSSVLSLRNCKIHPFEDSWASGRQEHSVFTICESEVFTSPDNHGHLPDLSSCRPPDDIQYVDKDDSGVEHET